jgi:hypothetical protein
LDTEAASKKASGRPLQGSVRGTELAVTLAMTFFGASPAVAAAALLAALAPLGCVVRDNPNAEVDAELDRFGRALYGAQLDRVGAEWSATCSSADGPAASAHRERRCGLVYDEVTREPAMRAFIDDVCAEDAPHLGAATGDCRKLFREMVFAKWAERYDYVAPDAIERHCFAEPTVCRQPRSLELWLVSAHNEEVRRAYDAGMEQAHDEHVDRLASASRADAEINAAYEKRNARTFNIVMATYEHYAADWRCENREIAEGWEKTACFDQRD